MFWSAPAGDEALDVVGNRCCCKLILAFRPPRATPRGMLPPAPARGACPQQLIPDLPEQGQMIRHEQDCVDGDEDRTKPDLPLRERREIQEMLRPVSGPGLCACARLIHAGR